MCSTKLKYIFNPVFRSAQNFRFFAETILHHKIDKINHMKKMGKDYTSYSHGIPVGVAGLISAWNLPLYILTWKIAPAIAFGNTCVCKPAMLTSLTAFELCKIIKERFDILWKFLEINGNMKII
jgi:acyl-CoA reductase-like NAD-dependent aldehyde dehydrogenase